MGAADTQCYLIPIPLGVMMPICYLFLFLRVVLWEILNTFQRLCGNSQTPMIIIRPDLVIKQANSNLVLHRVREHLFMWLCVSIYLYISKYTCPCEVEIALLFVCVCQEKSAAEEKTLVLEILLRQGGCSHLSLG